MNDTDLQATLLNAMRKYWGYESFLPLQAEAMSSVLRGRDSLVVLPTGGGKSLCFQAPAMCRPGIAVVVSPLISLMKDQVDALRGCGVPAASANSSQSLDERRQVASDIRAGRLKLLYVSPEKLVTERMLEFLKAIDVSLFAIDEAHCISNWGHDFRPEYRLLRVLKEQFPQIGVHAYTATASAEVRADIVRELRLVEPEVLVGSFDRPNLIYKVRRREGVLNQIREVIDRHPRESGIVYCISRAEVEKTAAALVSLGYKAAPYHAGMSPDNRRRNQDDFIEDRIDIIVATIAFGMGIDKSNVRFVAHAGMPKSLEHYQQESGRAGRDGLEAECCLFFGTQDFVLWRDMLEGDAEVKAAGLKALQGIMDFCQSVTCRHRAIVSYFGQTYEKSSCGACDVCQGDLDLVEDSLVVGQKILSCVLRLNQRFGGDYTANVLIGSQEQRILAAGHDKLSTYGLLRDDGKRTVRDWIEQLVGQNFLEKEGEFQTLQVTAEGRRLLKSEVAPRLLRPSVAKKAAEVERDLWAGVDRGLFDDLRQLRHAQATSRQVPAYIVFSDESLREMARRRPSTLIALRQVPGVGEKKLADFGDLFLARILDYCGKHQLSLDAVSGPAAGRVAAPPRPAPAGPSTAAIASFQYFRQGWSVVDVGMQMSRAKSTVHGYLSEFIRHERITDPSPWVAADVVQQVESAIAHCGQEKLKPIFEHLNGAVGYEEIRIVADCLRNRLAVRDSAPPLPPPPVST